MAQQSSFRQQLKATLVRNLRLKVRDSRKTLMEVLIPLYTLGTLIVLKILIPNPNFPAILEPRGDGKLFEHFGRMKNHTIAVLPHGNTSRHQTTQVREEKEENFQVSYQKKIFFL
jgi:ATP-binding cassette, subfamily A (ABC1), member 5